MAHRPKSSRVTAAIRDALPQAAAGVAVRDAVVNVTAAHDLTRAEAEIVEASIERRLADAESALVDVDDERACDRCGCHSERLWRIASVPARELPLEVGEPPGAQLCIACLSTLVRRWSATEPRGAQ